MDKVKMRYGLIVVMLFVCLPFLGQRVDKYGLKVVKSVHITEHTNFDHQPIIKTDYQMIYDDAFRLSRLLAIHEFGKEEYVKNGNVIEKFDKDENRGGTYTRYYLNADNVVEKKEVLSERLDEDGDPIKGMVMSKTVERYDYCTVDHIGFPLLRHEELAFLVKTKEGKWADEDGGYHRHLKYLYNNGNMVRYWWFDARYGNEQPFTRELADDEYEERENNLNLDVYAFFIQNRNTDIIHATEWSSMRSKYLIKKENIGPTFLFSYEYDEKENVKRINVQDIRHLEKLLFEVDIEYMY